jgi:hypothetical protein
MVNVKLLVVVTNDSVRRRLLDAWRAFVVGPGRGALPGGGEEAIEEAPVAFGRVDVREGLSLYVFIVEGGWRREYVCRVLAGQVFGYCLVVGPDSNDLLMAEDLLTLLDEACPDGGVVAATAPEEADLVCRALSVPPQVAVTTVDCESRSSISEMLCVLLEHLAAAPAA